MMGKQQSKDPRPKTQDRDHRFHRFSQIFSVSICVICVICGYRVLCLLGGGPVARAQRSSAEPINITEYVPLDHGRTWTYQWTLRYGDGRKETTSRTKSFEGPEFLPTGYAHKFVSDLGDYALLSVDNRALRLHGSVEPHRAIRFTFDPPVVLYSPEMEFGRPYTITQPADDGGTRTCTTVVDGFEDVSTPMGQFHRCLKIRLEINSSDVRTKAVYYYARGLGLVAYQYEAWVKNKERPEVAIDAGLKLAQLVGQTISNASQLETLEAKVAAGSPRLDDPEARKMFRQAYGRLYYWPAKFPGFQAEFALRQGLDEPDSQDPRPKTQDPRPMESVETDRHPPSAIHNPQSKMWPSSPSPRALERKVSNRRYAGSTPFLFLA